MTPRPKFMREQPLAGRFDHPLEQPRMETVERPRMGQMPSARPMIFDDDD
jgi:hypothetical protein